MARGTRAIRLSIQSAATATVPRVVLETYPRTRRVGAFPEALFAAGSMSQLRLSVAWETPTVKTAAVAVAVDVDVVQP